MAPDGRAHQRGDYDYSFHNSPKVEPAAPKSTARYTTAAERYPGFMLAGNDPAAARDAGLDHGGGRRGHSITRISVARPYRSSARMVSATATRSPAVMLARARTAALMGTR